MSEKIILDAHPSVVIAYSEEAKKLLMSIYDEGYPIPVYRGSANNIGGNPEPWSISPENVLLEEIAEEFDPNHPEEKKHVGKVPWASSLDIRFIQNALLGAVSPFQDFYVEVGKISGGHNPHKAIFSTFFSLISGEVIERAERNIKEDKHLTTEGLAGVFTLDELIHSPRREFSTAHATAPILNYRFESKIPYPKEIVARPIGPTRRSFSDYLPDYSYNNENLRKASKAEEFTEKLQN